MRLTVAICTWNRARLLEKTLEGMTGLEIPPELSWELLVVDNHSDDETEAVAASFQARLPIRYLYEGRQGKTHAANLAVKEASGEAILWTDDDVLVHSRWLSSYAEALTAAPDTGFFGGPIRAEFEGSPPQWLLDARDQVGPVFAEMDLGPRPILLDGDHYPLGANMAIRKSLHDRFPFDTRIGRRGRSLMGASETFLFREIFQAGEVGQWVPDARVVHIIPEDRQTLSYVRRFFFGAGQVLTVMGGSKGPFWFGKPRWAWRQAVQAEILYRVTRPWRPSKTWLRHLGHAALAQGILAGAPRRQDPNP